MKTKIIYIRKDEDLASIVEKVLLAKEKEIVLVIPEEADIARHKINFQILKREASFANKEIFIDTDDKKIRGICKEENIKLADDYSDILGDPQIKKEKIPVSDIMPSAKKTDSFKIKSESFVRAEGVPLEEEKVEEAPDFWEMLEKKHLEKREKIVFSEKDSSKPKEIVREEASDFSEEIIKEKRSKKFFYFTSLALLLVLGLMCYFTFFVLPKAQIILDLKKAQKTVEFGLEAKADIIKPDLENYLLPARVLTFERTAQKTFPATGEKEVETKASGIIRIYNAYSSKPQVLVATTRFQSSDGKIFRIPKRVVVPGAKVEGGKIIPSYIEVKVYADKPGEEYNIGPDKFTIPGFKGSDKYYGFYGQSFESMKGGAVKKVRVVTQADIENAKNEVEKELVFLLEKEFKQKTPPDFLAFDGNYELTKKEIKVDAKVGEARDNFSVSADFILKGVIVKKSDFNDLVKEVFAKLAEAQDWKIKGIRPGCQKDSFDFKRGEFSINCKVDFSLVRKIDENKIEKEVLGKDASDVKRALISEEAVDSIKIILWPFWVNKVPNNPNKVKIIFQ